MSADKEIDILEDCTRALGRLERAWDDEKDEDWERMVSYLLSRFRSIFDRARMIEDGE